MKELEALGTERTNRETESLDQLSPLAIAEQMNREDARVAEAVRQELVAIARVIEMAAAALGAGGRLFYVGTGSSGRLGVLDASELPPTFGIGADRVIGLIAGGDEALRTARAALEDDEAGGRALLEPYQVGERDLVVGLTASGRTPFVRAALAHARERGARTALVCCNQGAAISPLVDVAVEVAVGPEVIAGSTRLKAGTAQKMVLNMISTGAMVRLGKVYRNLMVDLQVGNEKLYERAMRIIEEAAGVGREQAEAAYRNAGGVKLAIVCLLTGLPPAQARERLVASGGRVREATEG